MDAHADLKHPVDLSWTAFLHALDVAKFAPSDRAILERMFTLMDKTGDDLVSRRELLVGACVLLQGDLLSKLQGLSAPLELRHCVRKVLSPFDATAAVEIHRMSVSEPHGLRRPSGLPSASHRPSYDALLFILSTFATVTSFFGDPLLKKTALSKAVHDVLNALEGTEEKGGATNAALNGLAHHPVVERYIHQLAIDAESHEAV
jgi:hypothetical protein